MPISPEGLGHPNPPRGETEPVAAPPIREHERDAVATPDRSRPQLDLNRLAVVRRRKLLDVPAEPGWPYQDCPPSPDQNQPATLLVEHWRALVGFTLTPCRGAAPQLADLAAQAHMLGYLFALPADSDWAVQLRLVAHPDPSAASAPAALAVTLLGAASGETEESAVRGVKELAAAIAVAGGFLASRYDLAPLVDDLSLEAALSPFPFGDLVEVGRRHHTLTVSDQNLRVPLPLPGRATTGQLLCEALVAEASRRGRPLAWAATLEAASDTDTERVRLSDAFARLHAAEDTRLGVPDSAQAAVAVREHSQRRETTARALATQWRALAGLTGRVQAFLVADEGGVPPALLAAAIAELSDGGAGDEDASTAPAVSRHAVRPREVWRTAPVQDTPGGLILGDNVAGSRQQPVALSPDDRRRHFYVSGQTGTGKSTLLLNLITQDLVAGRGVCVIDPHGELISGVLARIPRERVDDVILLDPADQERPLGYNFLECPEEMRDQVVESFVGLLYALFDPNRLGIVGPQLEHAVRNSMLTAMATEGMTLIEVVRLLTDDDFVKRCLPQVTDPLVRRYWTDQVAKTTAFHRSEMLGYIVSKFSPFVHNRLVRNIVGQARSSFDLRQVMDEGKILLVDLAQGRLGQHLSTFLGSVIVPKLLLAALSRADVPTEQRRDFGLYVDEFQHYATPALVDMISGGRKFGLNLVLANQHVGQLPDDVRAAVFGNVGTTIALRAGVYDAALLAAAMQPSAFDAEDYVELPNYRAIARVLADGRYQPCFTLATRPQSEGKEESWGEAVRALSRLKYGRSRELVEEEIAERGDLDDEEDEDDVLAPFDRTGF